MKEPESNEWINTREAARHLAVPVREIYRLIDDGRLPAYKFGNDITPSCVPWRGVRGEGLLV